MATFTLKGVALPFSLELRPGLNRIGRNAANDFEIADASISSFHCEISVEGDRVQVKDIGSTNGTFIQQQKITEAPLATGQILRLGSVDFLLEGAEVPLPNVAIPELSVETIKTHGFLEDGSPACLNHESVAAIWQCANCGETFCNECVRSLGVAGHKAMVFCPACGGSCGAVAPQSKKTKKTFFDRLTKTLKKTLGG